jgi:hypothetical protein
MAYIGQPVSTLITIPNSGVTGGTYGNATIVPVITIGNDGRITSAANVTITTGGGGGGSISITNDVNTDSNTFYILLANNTDSGTLTAANVSNTKLFFNANTGVLTATDFNSLSDETLKINVQPIENATEAVIQIQGVEFNWADNGRKSSGFIAQQLEPVLPHLVTTNSNGIKTVNYDGVIAYLVQTVKELDARVKELERKNGI